MASHDQNRRFRSQTWISVLAAVGIVVHLLLRYLFRMAPSLADFPLYLTVAAGGAPLLWSLVRHMVRMEFGSDLLAGLSIIASISTGQFLVGSIIVLMLSGGTALEAYASRQANSALAALHQRAPRIAHRKTGASWTDIGLEDIRPGDILAILSQEVAPVDGTVVEGYGRMDESYLTGEPFEISKAPGSSVISGSVNKDQILIVRASKTPDESRYAQIVRLLEATEANRPQMRRLGDKLAAWYTPVAVITALTAWLLSRDSLRFLAVTVIAT